jgi:flagellar hook-basal body protein
MLRSLNSGVTGLINHQTRMDVIGNNISNVNTIGYKNRRVTFGESFSQMVKGATRTESQAGGTNAMQIGLGVQVSSVDMITGQGTLTNTGRTFDLAIDGNAFFGVSDGQNTYYTRNGAFQLDSEGYIVIPTNGMVLQGRMADAFGNFPPGTAIGNMKIPMSQQAPAKATTNVEIMRNLPMDGDAKGNVQYTQKFLHPADSIRLAGANSNGNPDIDPGKTAGTPLSSLFNSNGDYLNIKEGDTISISWYDKASIEVGVTPKAAEFHFLVQKPPNERDENGDLIDWGNILNAETRSWQDPDGIPSPNNIAKVYTLDDLLKAMQNAINSVVASGSIAGEGVRLELQDDGSIKFINDGKNYGQAEPTGTKTATDNIFRFNVTSSNPLSKSPLGLAFNFGSYVGPGIPNTAYEPVGNTTSIMWANALPRSVPNYIVDTYDNPVPADANGRPLYASLDGTSYYLVDANDPPQPIHANGTPIGTDPWVWFNPHSTGVLDWSDAPTQTRKQGTITVYIPANNDGPAGATVPLYRVPSADELNPAKTATFDPTLVKGVYYAIDVDGDIIKIAGSPVIYDLHKPTTPPLVAGDGSTHVPGVDGREWGQVPKKGELALSDKLLRPVEQFDYLSQVLDANGNKLNLDPGDSISFDGSIGRNKVQSRDLAITNTTLFDDIMAHLGTTFKAPGDYPDRDGTPLPTVSISMDGDPTTNPMFGSLVIRSLTGADFAINNLTTSFIDGNRASGIPPSNFIANMGMLEKEKARDCASFDIPLDVYDDGGTAHTLTITFTHTGRNGEWEWSASFPGNEIIEPGTGKGRVFFGLDNTVSSWLYDGGGSQLIVNPRNGSGTMRITLDPGKDSKGLTQYDADATVAFRGQNGYPSGALVEVSINAFGLVEGRFSNGTARAIGQIMVVDFANPGGLIDLADCIFTTSANSGDPVWGRPKTQSSSELKPGALEMSNVDLGMEFTNMITTQRGYQANSRIVTVSDSMLEELVNLKR